MNNSRKVITRWTNWVNWRMKFNRSSVVSKISVMSTLIRDFRFWMQVRAVRPPVEVSPMSNHKLIEIEYEYFPKFRISVQITDRSSIFLTSKNCLSNDPLNRNSLKIIMILRNFFPTVTVSNMHWKIWPYTFDDVVYFQENVVEYFIEILPTHPKNDTRWAYV